MSLTKGTLYIWVVIILPNLTVNTVVSKRLDTDWSKDLINQVMLRVPVLNLFQTRRTRFNIMHHRPTMADTTEVQTLDTFFKPHSTMT